MTRCLALLVLAAMCFSAQEVVFRTESRLVEVYATVLDDRGKYMDGLVRDRFVVSEDGKQQSLVAFESDAAGLDCAVLLDTTGSMGQELPRVKNAVAKFIDELRDDDSIAIYSFTTSLDLLQDFTRDRALAKRAVMRTRAAGGTALFDAIARPEIKDALRANTDEVMRRGGFGSPTIFVKGDDMYFGNDRLPLIRAALTR